MTHVKRFAAVAILLFTASSASPATEDFELTFKQAVKLVEPYLVLTDKTAADARGPDGTRDLGKAVEMLTRVTEHNPKNFAAYWFIGKALQARSEHSKSFAAFKQALALQPANVGVAREFVISAVCVGATREAVATARDLVAAHPGDAGLQANLGLALLADGDLPQARAATDQALALTPDHPVALNLRDEITAVQSGRKPGRYCTP